ncbi:DUF192 domain-containing protein [Candidatus Acetothermia bacterium]|nr:DUF192 domain-containing protein [Candidatus Acetothermia bacterium]MBI3643494.1 DUF192 domain-containing protein [Candidatus Acetothermia bacterium]
MHVRLFGSLLFETVIVGLLLVISATMTGCGVLKGIMNPEEAGTTPIFNQMKSQVIQLKRADGFIISLTVKIADNDAKLEAGFQNISPEIIQKSFILFVFGEPLRALFHMHNVLAPLDIAFIAGNGTLIKIETMAVGPELYGPDEPFQYALEARAGFFAENKLVAKESKLVTSSLRQKEK